MFRRGTFFLFLSISALSLIISDQTALAQHGGGGGGMGGGSGGGSSAGRPGGVSEKDDLRSFHRAIALQATAQQSALFNTAIQDVENANAQLQAFRAAAQTVPPAPAATMHDLIEKVHSSNQSFLASFSSAQKAGLKDVLKKLAKEDSELARQAQAQALAFDQGLQSAKPTAEQLASATSLEKTLTGFQTQQLALATEMSIVVTPAGEETTFNLPALPNRLNIAGQSLAIPSSGVVVRTSKENGHNIFTLTLDADLFDLQQNITDVLSSALNRSPNCGERVEFKQALLAPAAPASLVTVHLHYERWICALGGGAGSSTEAIASDGSLEVKLTPTMAQTSGLGLDSEIIRADSSGSLRNMLRSGDLGDNLRQQIAATVLAVLRQATNPESVLPSSAKENLSLQKAQFQNAGSDKLSFRLNGELQFSDEQAKLFADQLKHRPSFKETSAR